MSTFTVTLGVADRFRERYVNVDALVDTGSTYTSLPESLLDDLGIDRTEIRRFEAGRQSSRRILGRRNPPATGKSRIYRSRYLRTE